MIKSINELLALITQQKSQLDALRPFDEIILDNLRQRFRIGFIQNSNAIEGNTFSLSEVKILLEDGVTVGGKTIRELRETINHGDLMDKIHNLFADNAERIDETMILGLHDTLMQGLLPDHYRGKWRTIEIMVTGSDHIFPLPAQIPQLMEDFFQNPMCHPQSLEDVARLHFDFINIHPFVDGNGRIVRILMNIGLITL